MRILSPLMVGKASLDKPYWLDEVGDLAGKFRQGPERIVDNVQENYTAFADTCTIANSWLCINTQLNHNREHATIIKAHLHWRQADANVPNWIVYYRWQVNGQPWVEEWTPIALLDLAFSYTGTAMLQISKSVAISAPGTDGLSSIVQTRLTRDTANTTTLFAGLDPLVGGANGVSFDLHKQIDSFGSMGEYTKFV